MMIMTEHRKQGTDKTKGISQDKFLMNWSFGKKHAFFNIMNTIGGFEAEA